MAKWQEMGAFFQKNPYIWIPIFGKITPEDGMGLQLSAAHPQPIQIWDSRTAFLGYSDHCSHIIDELAWDIDFRLDFINQLNVKSGETRGLRTACLIWTPITTKLDL